MSPKIAGFERAPSVERRNRCRPSHNRYGVPHRARSARRIPGPRRRLLRRADGARASRISHQRADGARQPRRGDRPRQARGRRGQPRARSARSGAVADAIIAAADEILAGGLRDQFVVDVYQAGAGTSHNMNTNEVLANRAAEIARRRARHLRRRASQRSRQHGPVDQRRVSDGDAAGACCSSTARFVAAVPRAGRRVRAQGRAVRGRAQGRAARICRTRCRSRSARSSAAMPRACARPRTAARHAVAALCRTEPRRDGGRHGAQRRRRLHAARDRGAGAADQAAAAAGAQPLPRHAEHGRRRRLLRRAAADWPSSSARSPAICACCRWARARASARSGCRPCSPDRRSCRARSIRRCRRWSIRCAIRCSAATRR